MKFHQHLVSIVLQMCFYVKILRISLCIWTHNHIRSVLVVLKMGQNCNYCAHQNQNITSNFSKLLMPFHKARNVVVHLHYSFQLRPLAMAWQSVKLEGANFVKFRSRTFCVFWLTL